MRKIELLTSAYAVEEARRNLDREKHKRRLLALLSRVKIVSEPDPGVPCPADLPPKDRPLLVVAIQPGEVPVKIDRITVDPQV